MGSVTVVPASPSRVSDLLAGGMREANAYNEVFASDGSTREPYRTLLSVLDEGGQAELQPLRASVRRRINEQEVTFNILGVPEGTERPWLLDPLPVVIAEAEWTALARGLAQRARLVSLIYADLYGAQRLLRARVIPPELIFAHPEYARPCVGWTPLGGQHIRLFAADCARAKDGNFYVFSDRTAAPAGSGYSLENRLVLGRSMSKAFNACRVERVRQFFDAVRESVREVAPAGIGEPRVVLLSPGARDESSFEHAYLARYLGYELVEGRDLTVRDDVVYLKTLGGLQRVDVVLRRLHDSLCDPLTLREVSHLGVPGLVRAAAAGNVGLVNPLGSAVLESPAIKAYLPQAAEYLLGESLQLPSVETLWCGERTSLQRVVAQPDAFVIKPTYEDRHGAPQRPALMDRAAKKALLERITAAPGRFVAERWPQPSIVPMLEGEQVSYGTLSIRAFLCRAKDQYEVMPGGLARVNGSPDGIFMDIQSERASKDVWVTSSCREKTLVPPAMPDARVHLRRGGVDLPSRLLDDLYWLGRYVERADMSARLLRAAFDRIGSEGGQGQEANLSAVMLALRQQEVVAKGSGSLDAAAMLSLLLGGLLDTTQPNSLYSVFQRIRQLTLGVRSRLSRDAWHVLRRGVLAFQAFPSDERSPAGATELLNESLTNLAAISGTILENMVRGHAWLFLDMGRRVERGNQTLSAVRALLPAGAERSHMETLLEVADSLLTYRARYLSSLQVGPVVDLVLTDETNPRSLVFQVNALCEHIRKLPRLDDVVRSRAERRIIELQSNLMTVDILTACAGQGVGLRQLLDDCGVLLWQVSDDVSHTWFSHATAPHALAAPGWINEELEAQ